jgi:type II secretory pathway pseudopilin PulG
MKIRCGKVNQGTTMVDVIMSVAVIAVMATGLVGSLSYGYFVMELARENQRATQVLMERTEAIRLYNWDQVNANGFIPTNFTDVYDPQAPSNAQGVTYYGTLSKSPVLTSMYGTNLVQLSMTLTWKTKTLNHTRSLTTYIAKDGIQNYVY